MPKLVTFTPVLFTLILLFASLGQVTADMYIPSFPSIAKTFHVSASQVQVTMSVFLLGFSASHLYYGPLSDHIGRRKPMLIGIGLSALGSLICFLAPSISVIIMGRLLQGIGVGTCNSVGRSITRDLLSGNHLARFGSHLGMIAVLFVAFAPTIGGYIQYYFQWRANFLMLFLYSSFIWIFTFLSLSETNQSFDPNPMHIKNILKNYQILLHHKGFLGYSLCSCFAYAGMIAYITAAPFLFQSVLGLSSKTFGWIFFITAAAIFIVFYINGKIIFKIGIQKMVLFGNSFMLSGGLLMLLLSFSWLNSYVILIPMILFSIGVGFTFSNAFAGAFHYFSHMSGSAGALYGFTQILGGALSSALIASLHTQNQIPLAILLSMSGLFAMLSLKWLASKVVLLNEDHDNNR